MKCLILAGGKGDRLWPLSRENYPKQFIPLQQDHSLFQETIVRNLPFCDEFIISANAEHENIIKNQMKAFQGVTYRCIFEEKRIRTAPAILFASMEVSKSEIILAVPADNLITGTYKYRDDILRGKEYAKKGYQTIYGFEPENYDKRYGYMTVRNGTVNKFKEKPKQSEISEYIKNENCLVSGGIFIFQAGRILKEYRETAEEFYLKCEKAYKNRKVKGNAVYYSKKTLKEIPAVSIEKTLFEKSGNLKAIKAGFDWKDINSLDDLHHTNFENKENSRFLNYDTDDISLINLQKDKVIAANGIKGLTIINTDDVLYIGKTGSSDNLKQIVAENNKKTNCFKTGNITYRHWGRSERIYREDTCEIRKIYIYPGKTIYIHSHKKRNEHWIILQGEVLVTADDIKTKHKEGQSFKIEKNIKHQLSNTGDKVLICIETDTGQLTEEDTIKIQSADISETELGFTQEPAVKLTPNYKDALWGGVRLKETYKKQSDLETIAESWELSAHPAGQSVIAEGVHRGMLLSDYLKSVCGKELGWKCKARDEFPILIKFIDAKLDLSIQVHPGDEYAMEHENQYGKNEMWYILEAEKEASIYCGFKKDTNRKEVETALKNRTIENLLNKVPVKKGDVFFIEAGTVHGILSGVMICEIQQSSDCTYRLYDYERRDKFGNKRELHIEKALDVLNYKQYSPQKLSAVTDKIPGGEKRILGRCKYFESVSYKIEENMKFKLKKSSFVSLICVSGRGEIQFENEERGITFRAGESILIPDGRKEFEIKGSCEIVGSWI
ncbi:MAG: cupin domain-containing protein [Firmicutes bacterium]|nr:cupin domain-containing protein [Bacillota bacterium]